MNSLEKIILANLFIVIWTYGAFISMSGTSLFLLLKYGKLYKSRRIIMLYMATMFALSSIWCINYAKLGLTVSVDHTDMSLIVSRVSTVVQYFVSDGILLFRVLWIWKNNMKIMTIIPIVIYIISVVSGIMVEVARWRFEGQNFYIGTQWAFYTSTILFNAYTTCAIGYKTFPVSRWSARAYEKDAFRTRDTHAIAALLIFMENGAVYTIIGIIYGALLTSSNSGNETVENASAVMGHIWASIVVLGPSLVILRVAIGLAAKSCVDMQTPGPEWITSHNSKESIGGTCDSRDLV